MMYEILYTPPLYGGVVVYVYIPPISRAISEAVKNLPPRVPPSALYSDSLLLSGMQKVRIIIDPGF